MPRPFTAAFLAATALATTYGPLFAQDVTIETVTLATGGLANVEGRMVGPGSEMELAIEREHVSDVLRTLVVTGETPVRSIDLQAAEPLDARTPEGRLLAGDLADPSAILDALIGEEVEIAAGTVRLVGRLLAYDEVTLPAEGEGEPRPALRISVATPENRIAFATVPLGDPIAIDGEAMERRLAALLPGIAAVTDETRRTLKVTLSGEGTAGFRFVIPTTIWRPSYRATIGDGSVLLQGWATLENTTGFDWNDVRLRLAVGTPVAYAQDVYSPLRTTRPNAPFAVGQTAEVPIVSEQVAAPGFAAAQERMFRAAPSVMPEAVADVAAPLETGERVAERAVSIFDVPTPVTLESGRALSVPFLDASAEANRVAYIDLADANERALDALELSFDDEATVPGGLIAVYGTEGFLGDARFDGSDGGTERILPFAVSSDLNVETTQRERQAIARVAIADGTLRLTRDFETIRTVALDAAEPTTLVLDGSRAPDAQVFAELSGGEVSASPLGENRYRVRAQIRAGESVLTVRTVRPLVESYVVSDIPTVVLNEVLALGGRLDERTRQTLDALAALSARLADLRRREQAAGQEIDDLTRALETDRENLAALGPATPEGASIRQRIVERANALDALLGERRELQRQIAAAERELRAG